jgi:cobalamin biosynthesis protein CbiD
MSTILIDLEVLNNIFSLVHNIYLLAHQTDKHAQKLRPNEQGVSLMQEDFQSDDFEVLSDVSEEIRQPYEICEQSSKATTTEAATQTIQEQTNQCSGVSEQQAGICVNQRNSNKIDETDECCQQKIGHQQKPTCIRSRYVGSNKLARCTTTKFRCR